MSSSSKALLTQIRSLSTDLERYLFLRSLQDRNEATFYDLLLGHPQDVMPFVYTPTVGEACQKYSHLPLRTRGLYITANDRGRVLEKLREWPEKRVRVVVITDGERILGLGDLGAGGMGISEGKILLYTVVAGVDPSECMPICLDVGTNNESLLADPKYCGMRQHRLRGHLYEELLAEFFSAMKAWQPHTLVQFEDFANPNAFELLRQYRDVHCCFNDDIQGTACIVLAGLLAGLRITGGDLSQQRFLFMGAGEAGTGIAELIALALNVRHGIPLPQARFCTTFS
jgi:malate dehydrogenase (oxaloacetate-decarboxylating)(NADP+)